MILFKEFLLPISILINILLIFIIWLTISKREIFLNLLYKMRRGKRFSFFVFNYLIRYPFYDQRESLFKVLPSSINEIVFLGDSLTNGCEWSELFQNPNIKNRGIESDNSLGVHKRIGTVIKSKPNKIFIMIGVNDLGSNTPIEIIIENFNKIIQHIKDNSPSTIVYIQSILPTNSKLYKGAATNNKIKELNLKLKNLTCNFGLYYIDIFSFLIDSAGDLDQRYSNDGLHLLAEGYLVWKNVIEKYISKT